MLEEVELQEKMSTPAGEETDKLAHVVSYGSEKGALKRDEETPPSPSALDCHMTVQANPLQDSTSPSSDLYIYKELLPVCYSN
ncbi:hypothetical protein HPP92_011850 [Vanilla planifolia]|uniref:Uncharacterized protein n=1 Tax=Vanilla planifolia TaxID=51239 RepID=A0A835R6J4_VANPL|nr:hypothetical protein HPP92_011850 [Vanilla planifolia]